VSNNSWVQVIASQGKQAAVHNTYTTPISVIDPTALVTLPANTLKINSLLRVRASGSISNIVTTPGLMNFQVKIGSVAAFDTGNIQLNATAHTTLPFMIDIEMTVYAVGSSTSANAMGQATVTGKMFTFTAAQTDDAQDMPTILGPATAPAVGTGFDSTVSNTIDFFAGFTISNVANQIQIAQYRVYLEN